jgi:hypothetical protein
MMYQIEFIRRVAGRIAPEILQRANMEATSLEVVKNQARAMFDATRHVNPEAEGYQIVENGSSVVYQWNSDDDA